MTRYGDSGQARTSDLDKLEKRIELLEKRVEQLEWVCDVEEDEAQTQMNERITKAWREAEDELSE